MKSVNFSKDLWDDKKKTIYKSTNLQKKHIPIFKKFMLVSYISEKCYVIVYFDSKTVKWCNHHVKCDHIFSVLKVVNAN